MTAPPRAARARRRGASGVLWLAAPIALLLAFVPLLTRGIPAASAQDAPWLAPGTAAVTVGEALVRAEPGYDAAVVGALAPGTAVEVTDGPFPAADGTSWYAVWSPVGSGYLDVWAISADGAMTAGVAQAAESDTWVDAPAEAPLAAAAEAVATSDVNLRAGPSTADAVLLVIPPGAAVSVLDPAGWVNGFLPVAYNGVSGWAYGEYIQVGGAAPNPTAADAPPPSSGQAVTTTDLNLRAGASTSDAVLLVIPPGAAVSLTGETSGDFTGVDYNGQAGWVASWFLSTDGSAPTPDPGGTPSGPGTTTTTSDLNLRAGPSTADAVLLVMPPGGAVELLGESANGYELVAYNGTTGWAFAGYLASGGDPPVATPDPGSTGGATTTSELNLRAGPSAADSVLSVIPNGAAVTVDGAPQNGFYPISYSGQSGWAAGDYLSIGGDPSDPGANFSLVPPTTGGGGLIWPVSGGWYISQGYNGSSHQNNSDLWQYYYSFDLARSADDTAGQGVVSPGSGTVRWLDPSTGGISIDIGNGHAIAMFHLTVDPSLQPGTAIGQGQFVGSVSGPGGPGYMGFAHLHLSLWETSDGGNWSRSAVPFTGAYALSGQSFPDIGGSNQHRGTEV